MVSSASPLVWPMRPDGAALDPAGRVDARDRRRPRHPSTRGPDVRDDAARARRTARRQRRAAVADRAVDRLHGDVDELAGARDGAVADRARCARSARPRRGRRRAPRRACAGSAGAGGATPSAASRRACASRSACAVMTLTWLFARAAGRRAGRPRRARSPRRSTMMSTSGTSPSSRSSIGVNFTWAGPRRPNTCTSVTGDASRPATTFAGTSVEQQVPRSASRARGRRRARRCRCR